MAVTFSPVWACLAAVPLTWWPAGRLAAETPWLEVSANRRFLVTAEGEPFFWLGDTAWEIFHRLDREEAARWQREILRAMAEGLAEGDGGRHLITYHPRGGESSSEFFHAEPWLDFNMLQSGHARSGTNYGMIAHDYALEPAKPCFDGEPAYEYPADEMPPDRPANHNGALEVRRRAYWGVFAGGFGHTYGTHSIWQMHDAGREPRWGVVRPWHESLDLPGSGQMVHLRRLMMSRPFLARIPDQAIVTSAPAASAADHVQATRDGQPGLRDATYLMAYFPGPVSATIDASVIAGPRLRAWWFDPRSGGARPIGDLENTGPREFTPPAGDDGGDWVLVIDDASADRGPPGGD